VTDQAANIRAHSALANFMSINPHFSRKSQNRGVAARNEDAYQFDARASNDRELG
jgi:hypothetical protein